MPQRRILTRALVALLVAIVGLSATACGLSKEQAPESAQQLIAIKGRMDALDQRVMAVPTRQPVTPASLSQYAEDVQPLIGEYGDLLADAEATHKSVLPIDDSAVNALWLLLIKRIRASHDGLVRTTGLIEKHRWSSLLPESRAWYAEVERLDAQLTRQANLISER